ncbi:MAG TPA: glutamate racemase [Xanthobacteraceae bacterium]|nr:glutamate racemase [Xanthobacteraceae bacterium]
MARPPRVLVFDSGLGGLTVFQEIAKIRPDADYVYAADDAFFPYGAHGEAALSARVVPVIGDLIAQHQPDLVVIACNTASTLVLAKLRAAFTVPFIGTVPAIKPACAMSKSKRVSVLGTKATVTREYTKKLIADFGHGCDIKLVGSAQLAAIAETVLRGQSIDDGVIAAEIAPCFVNGDGRSTDTVVLACTHYPLLLERFKNLAPWPVNWIDPAPAIARRVIELIGPSTAIAAKLEARAVFTTGLAPEPALANALFSRGFTVNLH